MNLFTTPLAPRPVRARLGRRWAVAAAAGVTAVGLAASACIPTTASTKRVSVGAAGQQADAPSSAPSLSANGRFVAFVSLADNLAGSSAGLASIFLKDRTTGAVERISVNVLGQRPSGGGSTSPSVSADASRVAFDSRARDLTGGGDANGDDSDVFVRVRAGSGATLLVSRSSAGVQGNGPSTEPDISADGGFVAFESDATNLGVQDGNGRKDVFLHEIGTGGIRQISLNGGGTDPSVSANGARVAFITQAPLDPRDADASDPDVYVRDVVSGGTTLASFGGLPPHAASDPDISDDGRFVAFISTSGSAAPQAWVRDLQTGDVTLLSHPAGSARQSAGRTERVAIAPDGGHVAFASAATDLVAGDTNSARDVFVADRTGGGVARVSVIGDGGQANGSSSAPSVASGGRIVAFDSSASNLVPGDTNAASDVFVRDRG